MKFRTIVSATGLTLLGLFTILNWDTFSRPTLLDMVVARVDAPLGIILLCAIGVLTLIYALSVARLEITVQLEARRMKTRWNSCARLPIRLPNHAYRRCGIFLSERPRESTSSLTCCLSQRSTNRMRPTPGIGHPLVCHEHAACSARHTAIARHIVGRLACVAHTFRVLDQVRMTARTKRNETDILGFGRQKCLIRFWWRLREEMPPDRHCASRWTWHVPRTQRSLHCL